MNISLRGKTAVITGADEGLGGAIASHFATLGCSLALIGRNGNKLDSKMKECGKNGLNPSQVMGLSSDLQQESEVEAMFAKVSQKLGSIHILVNCMGSMSYGSLSDTTPSLIKDCINSNVVTVVTATKAAVPFLKQTQGVVINISSTSARRTSPPLLAFSMSKAALDYFTQTAALELATYKIRVNAVSPAIGVFESMMDTPPSTPFQEFRQIPLKQQPPTVDDVTQAVAFLASDESLFISGENICVDNGHHVAGLPM